MHSPSRNAPSYAQTLQRECQRFVALESTSSLERLLLMSENLGSANECVANAVKRVGAWPARAE